MQDDDQGWTKVTTKEGYKGLVPTSYLATPAPASDIPEDRRTVTNAFASGGPGEVSVLEGEEVVFVSDSKDGWSTVITSKGTEGLIASWALQ